MFNSSKVQAFYLYIILLPSLTEQDRDTVLPHVTVTFLGTTAAKTEHNRCPTYQLISYIMTEGTNQCIQLGRLTYKPHQYYVCFTSHIFPGYTSDV